MSPLDEGDDFAIDVKTSHGSDTVLVTVPKGKGLALAYWLNRQFTETREIRLSRREADHLALLKETA